MNNINKLSIIIPVYNEKNTLKDIIHCVKAVKLSGIDKEIIIVDDYSTDGTRDIINNDIKKNVAKVIFHEKNMGKGAAIRTGIRHVSGDIIIIQDADLEYDPNEYPKLIKPIIDKKADVVYGSRFIGGDSHRVHYFSHYIANKILTFLSDCMTNLNLTDMETCYKVFRTELIKNLKLEQNRFGFEPEITAKVAKMKVRVYEVGISYYGRSYEEGKKIGFKDAIKALWCILIYKFKKLKYIQPIPTKID